MRVKVILKVFGAILVVLIVLAALAIAYISFRVSRKHHISFFKTTGAEIVLLIEKIDAAIGTGVKSPVVVHGGTFWIHSPTLIPASDSCTPPSGPTNCYSYKLLSGSSYQIASSGFSPQLSTIPPNTTGWKMEIYDSLKSGQAAAIHGILVCSDKQCTTSPPVDSSMVYAMPLDGYSTLTFTPQDNQ